MKKVRTRFAPSPTGYVHVGGIRTALFAWLVARQNNGDFILRLEDTDKAREVEGSDKHIMGSLKALGLNYDEGPDVGGNFGPYRQSERLDIYKQYAHDLIDKGRAYADPYTASEVDEFRSQAKANKKPFLYRDHRPDNPPVWDGTQPLRFKSDPKTYTWQDEVMGELSAGEEAIDDFILIKSDGYPTYNFAHIVDDLTMEITHVIRSQEFIASTPKFLNLYEALDIERPKLATLPYVMGPDGKKKLSKRDGAKDVLDYIRDGYLQPALINFMATLGWNDGTEQEIFSEDELIQKFDLGRVHHSGARFDEQRLEWMNGAWIRNTNSEELYRLSENFWSENSKDYDANYKKQVLSLLQERLKYLAEIPELSRQFFEDLPIDMSLINDNKQLSKYSKDELRQMLEKSIEELKNEEFEIEKLTSNLNSLLAKLNQKPVVLFSLIRICLTWSPSSPGLAGTLEVIGKERSLKRLQKSLEALA